MLPITKRWRSGNPLLDQKGTKNCNKPPIVVTATQGISVIVRGPDGGAQSLSAKDADRQKSCGGKSPDPGQIGKSPGSAKVTFCKNPVCKSQIRKCLNRQKSQDVCRFGKSHFGKSRYSMSEPLFDQSLRLVLVVSDKIWSEGLFRSECDPCDTIG